MGRTASLLLLTTISGCALDTRDREETVAQFLSLAPLDGLPSDPTNRVFEDPDAAALGADLFFDTRLSVNGEIACATCHQPEHGFADPQPLSMAIATTRRHTPSLLNTAWNRWFYWDGRADSLWSQALNPLEAPSEHGFNRLALLHVLSRDNELSDAYARVFGPLPPTDDLPDAGRPVPLEPDHPDAVAWSSLSDAEQYAVNEVFVNIGKVLAAYQRTLVRRDSPFDRYARAYRQSEAAAQGLLSEQALRGLDLFVGEAGCINCHSGPTLSDLQFHNIGLSTASWMDPTDTGRFDGILQVATAPFNGLSDWSDDIEAGEEKLGYLDRDDERLGQFKTPSLRNIALTAPYMHSGQLATLEEVVAFYNLADGEPSLGHREEILLPLGLDAEEQSELVAFLESLTGEAFGE